MGTNLVDQLLVEGRQVFNFDDSGLGNLLNIEGFLKKPQHVFARCKISDPSEIKRGLLSAAADTIFICTCVNPFSIPKSAENLRIFLDTIVEWRESFARKAMGLQKIVCVLPHSLCNCKSDPRIELVRQYEGKLPIVTLTLPAIFGPFQQPDSPIPYAIFRAMEGETIPLLSPESVSFNFLYVKDAVKAIILVEEKGKIGHQYELKGPKEQLPNKEILEVICNTLNDINPPALGKYNSLIVEKDVPAVDISRHDGDESSLVELGLPSKTPIRDALAETVKWYYDNSNWYLQSKIRFFDLWQNPDEVLRFSAPACQA